MAVDYTGRRSAPCEWFYRNKPNDYFDAVEETGIMTKYLKDESGDQASPINGRLEGLFFLANVKPGSTDGTPQRVSAFGDTRLLVVADILLSKASNLYFVDFYCMKSTAVHYVTLVMTTPGSSADIFCKRNHLKQLSIGDREDNPFLFEDDDGQLRVSTRVTVELFFTRDINVRLMLKRRQCRIVRKVQTIGKGRSTPGGVPKNPRCTVCNVTKIGSAFNYDYESDVY